MIARPCAALPCRMTRVQARSGRVAMRPRPTADQCRGLRRPSEVLCALLEQCHVPQALARRPQKAKRRRIAPAPFDKLLLYRGSDDLEIDSLGAALVGFDFKADALALVQAAQSRRLHGGDVHEHVLAAIFGRDESKTFRRVEELNLTNHYGFLS